MKRSQNILPWLLGICLCCLASPALAQEMHTVNTPFQICCVEEISCARSLAAKITAMIPGLQTEVRNEIHKDSAGRDVSYYALYVWHKDLTADQICHQLGEKGCTSCRNGEYICPEKNMP